MKKEREMNVGGKTTANIQSLTFERTIKQAMILNMMVSVKNFFSKKFKDLSYEVTQEGICVSGEIGLKELEFFYTVVKSSQNKFTLKVLKGAEATILFTYKDVKSDKTVELRSWESLAYAIKSFSQIMLRQSKLQGSIRSMDYIIDGLLETNS